MKNKNLHPKKTLFIFLLSLAGMTNAFAQEFGQEFIVDDLKYEICGNYYSIFRLEVTGFADNENAHEELVIPDTVFWNGKKGAVIRIQFYSFDNCTKLTSITIPNSVTDIGSAAFSGCSKLSSISIPNSVVHIGENAFTNTGWYNTQPNGILYLDNCCLGYKGNKPHGTLQLDNDTRLIADEAFYKCTDLTGSLIIPNKVMSIGTRAFMGCSGFNGNLIIGRSVTEIGLQAFQDCTGLIGELTIPQSVQKIWNLAFKDCSGLKGNLVIENPKTKMEGNVFIGCDNLKRNDIAINTNNNNSQSVNKSNTSSISQRFYRPSGIVELSVFHEGMAAVKNADGKWGYVNRNGKMVISCQYQEARRFSEGLAAVEKNNVWGYIDKEGNTVIPFMYQNPYPFREGVAYVYLDKMKKYVLIDTKGNVLVNTIDMKEGYLPFSEGWAVVKPDMFYCYYIDKQGKRVTKNFLEARPFSEGLAAVCDEKMNRWGFIDKTGKVVIPCQYTTVRPFREGLAAVDGGYIDKSGNWVIPPKYIETSSFENGKALVIKSLSTVCVIDKSGRELYSYTNKYDNFTEIIGFSNGIAAAYNNLLMGENGWLTFNTQCKMLAKDGDGWVRLSYMDMKYIGGKYLLEFNNWANECLFPANKEDDLACSRRNGSKLYEKIYFYLDNQGNKY